MLDRIDPAIPDMGREIRFVPQMPLPKPALPNPAPQIPSTSIMSYWPGFCPCPQSGGPQRPAGKDRAVGRHVAQDDPLALAGEDHVMFADDVAAPDRAENPMVPRSRAPVMPSRPRPRPRQGSPPPIGRRLAQHQRGARGASTFIR
jgi:hypothetical protein